MMTFYAKVHQYQNEKLIAICDAELMGRTLKHNGIELNVSERFYGQLEYSKEEILIELKNATSVNVIGQDICEILIEENMVHEDTIMWIEEDDKIGHVIVVK